MIQKRFLDRQELAQAIGISVSSIDRRMRENVFPFSTKVKIGRRVLFPQKILEQLERQTVSQ